MGSEIQRATAVDPDDLEHAVAAQQALVGDRDARLGQGNEAPVQTGPVQRGVDARSLGADPLDIARAQRAAR
jgi:hypothetical protein